MARSTHFTTTTGAVTATLLPSASIFYGVAATSAEAAAFYIKLWWEGTGTAPPALAGGPQAATAAPIAGTTVPHLTLQVLTTGLVMSGLAEPLNMGGRIWYWVTAGAADNNSTVLVAGGDVITFIYD